MILDLEKRREIKINNDEITLNIRQKKVVQSDAPKILCLASAAAGKTRTLTERIKFLILSKRSNSEGIVAITFTNQAAAEMYSRLGKLGEKCFIGTVHSYANKLCINAGIDTMQIILDEQYDKLLELAMLIPRNNLPQIKYLMVDEC